MAIDKAVDSAALDAALVGIADAIRGKTGGTGKLTLDQMAAAIAGIQVGGGDAPGGGGMIGIYMAQITPTSDEVELIVSHNLGTSDILLAACWTEDMGEFAPTFDGSVLNVYLKSALPFRQTSNSNHENATIYGKWSTSLSNVNVIGQPNSSAYLSCPIGENQFKFECASALAAKYYGGVTYAVIIIAASAFVPTEV